MHGPHRHLDCKREQERNENQLLFLERERHFHESEEVETTRLVIKIDKRNQHQHRTEERVQEELKGCVDAPLATPDTDDEEHRYQHCFPQHIKQHAIECREDTDHQTFENQEGCEILCGPNFDRFPAGNDHQWRYKRCQQDQRSGNAVYAQVILNIERTDPACFLDKLHCRSCCVEAAIQNKTQDKRRK